MAKPEVRDWISGRWSMSMSTDLPPDAGNELVFGGGKVALAVTGQVIGRYKMNTECLTIILPMPHIPGEPAYEIIGQFSLIGEAHDRSVLVGLVDCTTDDGSLASTICRLTRLKPQA